MRCPDCPDVPNGTRKRPICCKREGATLRLKPGSLTANGVVVGLYPVPGDPMQLPVVVPADYGVSVRHLIGRCQALEQAGWVMCPAALMPRIPDNDQAVLIHRDSAAYRRWDALPPERKRAGAGR